MDRIRSGYRFFSSVILCSLALVLCLVMLSGFFAGPLIRGAVSIILWPVVFWLAAALGLIVLCGFALFVVEPWFRRRRRRL